MLRIIIIIVQMVTSYFIINLIPIHSNISKGYNTPIAYTYNYTNDNNTDTRPLEYIIFNC